MKKINFGLKLWSDNYGLLNEANNLILENIFDYIEIKVISGTKYDHYIKSDIPYIIHASSEINIADKSKERSNIELINVCLGWKNKLSAKFLILHPDFGSLNVAKKMLNRFYDKNIIIENMPKVGVNDEKMIGCNVEQIEKLSRGKYGFCLDFNHAVKAALSLNKDYKKYIIDLLKLDPKVCHISDGSLKNEKDEHLSLLNGEYDISFFADCIRNSSIAYVTMETPKTSLTSLDEDVKNVSIFKSFLSSKNN